MKYFILILLLCQAYSASAFSFRKIPLNKMIDKAELICVGQVIEVKKAGSALQNQLRSIVKSDDFKHGDPLCGSCNKVATFVINRVIKGRVQNDTVFIPYRVSMMHVLPGFKEGRAYVLFLSKLKHYDFFVKSDPRFGVKSTHLKEDEGLINSYLSLNSDAEKRKWIMNLSVNPRLSWEGILNFQYSNAKQFSESEKLFMAEGLLKMDFDKDKYWKLLDWVQEFGKNDDLIQKCFDRLQKIEEVEVDEGLDLMKAINSMNPQSDYIKLIDKFYDKALNSYRFGLIKEFIKKKKTKQS